MVCLALKYTPQKCSLAWSDLLSSIRIERMILATLSGFPNVFFLIPFGILYFISSARKVERSPPVPHQHNDMMGGDGRIMAIVLLRQFSTDKNRIPHQNNWIGDSHIRNREHSVRCLLVFVRNYIFSSYFRASVTRADYVTTFDFFALCPSKENYTSDTISVYCASGAATNEGIAGTDIVLFLFGCSCIQYMPIPI